jgi:hypothetical protein
MVRALRLALKPGSSERQTDSCLVSVGGGKTIFRLSAIPDSVSVAAARELVGQPSRTSPTTLHFSN